MIPKNSVRFLLLKCTILPHYITFIFMYFILPSAAEGKRVQI